MSNEEKIEIVEPEVLTEAEAKVLAENLSKMPAAKQKLELDKILDGSSINGFKVVIETIKIVKKSVDVSQKNNATFLNMCDTAISGLTQYINDDKISAEEQKKARKMINDIFEWANDARKESGNITKWVVGGSVVLGAVGILGYFISKIGKK